VVRTGSKGDRPGCWRRGEGGSSVVREKGGNRWEGGKRERGGVYQKRNFLAEVKMREREGGMLVTNEENYLRAIRHREPRRKKCKEFSIAWVLAKI